MSPVSSMDLLYADQFSVDYYENDISLITIGDTDQFLLLPEGMSAPVGLPDSIKILQKPVKISILWRHPLWMISFTWTQWI